VRGVVWLLAVAGCGRIAFDPLGDPVSDGANDDGVIAADCWAAWRAGTVTVGAPRLLDELSQAGIPAGDPSLSGDGLTLYFMRGTPPNIYYATRPTRTSRWTEVGPLSMLNTTSSETKLTVTADNTGGVFSSDRSGGTDLFLASRESGEWVLAPSQANVAPLNSVSDEYDPDLTADGLHLYYAPDPGSGQRIVVASRLDKTSAFTMERIVSELAIGTTYSDPSLSPDELVIAFAAMTNAMLFYATRTNKAIPFSAPVAIPSVHGPTGRETDSELSSDGCELYFSSTRSGAKDLYVSAVSP
jgi:Tol biopolymer transport system component